MPAAPPENGPRRCATSSANTAAPHRRDRWLSGIAGARSAGSLPSGPGPGALAERTGGPPRLLVAKPGLDGHSNGAEQIAVAARDAGFEVVYQGIRLSPEQIVAAARDEDVDVVGISILSGSHLDLVPDILDRLRAAGIDVPVVVGGIIPADDAKLLRDKGVAAVYTPKDFDFGRIMAELVTLAEEHRASTTGAL
jgi:(2R)-ethylmalonyl-CoA mutase